MAAIFVYSRVVRRLSSTKSNSQSDKSLLCWRIVKSQPGSQGSLLPFPTGRIENLGTRLRDVEDATRDIGRNASQNTEFCTF